MGDACILQTRDGFIGCVHRDADGADLPTLDELVQHRNTGAVRGQEVAWPVKHHHLDALTLQCTERLLQRARDLAFDFGSPAASRGVAQRRDLRDDGEPLALRSRQQGAKPLLRIAIRASSVNARKAAGLRGLKNLLRLVVRWSARLLVMP